MFSLKENVKWFNESLFVKASYKMVILLHITILFIIYIYIYIYCLIYIILYILFIVYYIYIYIYIIYIIKGASQSFPPCKNVTVFLCIFAAFIYFRESLDSLSKMWGEKW